VHYAIADPSLNWVQDKSGTTPAKPPTGVALLVPGCLLSLGAIFFGWLVVWSVRMSRRRSDAPGPRGLTPGARLN